MLGHNADTTAEKGISDASGGITCLLPSLEIGCGQQNIEKNF
jgi:hypothetical protein